MPHYRLARLRWVHQEDNEDAATHSYGHQQDRDRAAAATGRSHPS